MNPISLLNIDRTWNPIVGCLHHCSYCWAKRLVETKLKDTRRYKDGFKPELFEHELEKRFRNKFVFVTDMGDLFGNWVPSEWIIKVIDAIKKSPSSLFLFMTKNPKRYNEFLSLYPDNVVLGATIESNREYNVSNTPKAAERYQALRDLKFNNKMVSVEPIMDFDLETFVQWISDIKPILIHVGYDNYSNNLVEPPLSKTKQLIDNLRKFTAVKILTLREKVG
jgi:DNA repair photolyase